MGKIRGAFAVACALPFVVLLLPGPGSDRALTALAGLLTVVIVIVGWRLSLGRASERSWLGLALVYLGVVALLREAGGGNSSGLGPMVMLPAIAIAMVASRRSMIVVTIGTVAVYWVPIVLDSVRYPEAGYRIGVLFGCLAGLLGMAIQALRDQLRAQSANFERLALVDALTGLPNRRAWTAALDAALAAAVRRGETVCVAHIDLDRFKEINDSRGHAAGDKILTECASNWSQLIRRGDVLARLGGDEFAVALPGSELEAAEEVMQRMRRSCTGTTCSIGIARWDGREAAESVVARADNLLYDAKREGRDRIVVQADAVH